MLPTIENLRRNSVNRLSYLFTFIGEKGIEVEEIRLNHGKVDKDKTMSIGFFEVSSALPADLLSEITLDTSECIRNAIRRSDIHEHLSTVEKSLQTRRHEAPNMIMKVTRQDNPHRMWVAVDLDKSASIQVVGCIFVDTEEFISNGYPDCLGLEVKSLFVEEGLRGYGLGSKLLKYAHKFINSEGQRSVALVPENSDAIGFFGHSGYEAHGQEVVSVRDGNLPPIDFLFFLMSLRNPENTLED